eukprot:jgi/Hompol1/4296/HPOL_003572-RA
MTNRYAHLCLCLPAGFTLSYLEPNADTGVKDRLEMRIQFSETVDPSQIAAKLTEMAGEAKAVLSLKPNKNYTPPGRDKPTLLKYPSLLSWISMLLVWSAFMSLAFLPEVIYPLAVFRQAIGGMGASQNLVLGGVLIHAAEALAAVGFGVWAELPIEITFQYWFLIHFFGFAMLGPMIKMCLKRHEELEAKQEIRIQ